MAELIVHGSARVRVVEKIEQLKGRSSRERRVADQPIGISRC